MTHFTQITELLSYFASLAQWEDRYRALIQLSQSLLTIPECQKNEILLLPGCESKLWLDISKTSDGKIIFIADSDSKILRGILYIIQLYCSEYTKENIANMNFTSLFEQIGVLHKLSSNRKKGILAIEERINKVMTDN
ncbi:SufE family protein [Thorsellia kenyensis]|uniref:SufE family protein n=1 Tax=Thorsellia kenyensis TaxID=1549888 RepID=A0ABV6C850_9GAMM